MASQRPRLVTLVLAASILTLPVFARDSQSLEHLKDGEGVFDGDTYSFHHQLGALIDEIFQCFSEQMSGQDDNTVLFDGLSEFLDQYLDGTQPLVFEFETSGVGGGDSTAEIFSFAEGPGGNDLFPEGFEDPETGTPLTDACVEIGIDDTLDSKGPVTVTSATLDFLSGGTSLFGGPVTIPNSFFTNPWDGRLSLVVPGFTGLGIDETRLTISTTPDAQPIFADGFESGDTASWSEQVP